MRKIGIMLGLLMALSAAACNTVEGVGKDVQAGGRVLEDAAGDVKDKID